MCVKLMASVWALDIKPAARKLVLLALADCVNGSGEPECWPSQTRLASMVGIQRRMLIYHLNSLEQEGLIGRGGHRNGNVLYRLSCAMECTGATHCTPDVQPIAPEMCNPLHPNHKEPESTRKRESTRATDEAFDRFWRACNKRVAKATARKEFRAALKTVSADQLIEAMRRYADAERAHVPRQYWTRPSVWLRQGRWDDEEMPAPRTVAVVTTKDKQRQEMDDFFNGLDEKLRDGTGPYPLLQGHNSEAIGTLSEPNGNADLCGELAGGNGFIPARRH